MTGGTPRVVAENREALRSLMQLHPLNLTKLGTGVAAPEPPSPNPLVDKNPFGSVPLSALRESPRSVSSKGQASRGNDTGHFGAALSESVAQLHGEEEETGPTEDSNRGPLFDRPATVTLAAYTAFVKDQVS